MPMRYRVRRFIPVFLSLLLVSLLWLGPRASAAPSSVRWSTPGNISNSSSKSVYPNLVFDAAGAMHIAWVELAQTDGKVFYTNNIGGAFRDPFELPDVAGRTASSSLALAVEGNRVHLIFTDSDTLMRHRILTLDGARPSIGALTIIAPAKAYNPSAAVDKSGRVHAAWIDNQSGVYQVYHRIWANGGWEGAVRAVRPTGRYQSTPDLAVTNDGRVHAVYTNDKGLGYSNFNGSNWQEASDPGPGPTYQQGLATDGTNLFAVWSKTSHEVFYSRLANGSWSGAANIGRSGARNDFPSIAYSPSNNRVYAAWAIQGEGIGIREITPGGEMADIQVLGGAATAWPRVATSNNTIALIWHDRIGGAEDVLVSTASTVPAPPPTPTPLPGPPTGTFDFADGAFRDLWTRTDSLVQQGSVSYSWLWGPSAFTAGVSEYYVQSPGQARMVQYFDKSRMEINQPGAPRGPFYVTNGRLADELITGQMQTGDAQYEQRGAARIAVAGDPQNEFPQYRDLQAVYHRQRSNDRANEILYRAADGAIRTDPLPSANNDPSTVIAQRVAGLGIPKVFWDFMNRPGQVVENGAVVNANPLFDWRYVIGEPLTEAYWIVVNVGGVERGVLMQAFERRVLTYTPTNSPDFQVEMGNIGRHYFEWRYGVRP